MAQLRKLLPNALNKNAMRKYQIGGKKSKKTSDSAKAQEARRRDEALTRSLEGYAGTAYIKKQMGESSPAKSSSSKKSLPGFTSSAAASTYVKKPVVKKKAAKGTSLGMKSVKAGFDKNPGVTRADIIVAGKGKAKRGTAVKKAKVGSSMTRMANLRKGGKCKYGC